MGSQSWGRSNSQTTGPRAPSALLVPPSPWLSSTLFACHVAQVGYTNRNAQGTIGPFPWRYVGLAQPDTPDPTNVTNKREIFK